jgi:hypothetical protein
MNILNHILVIPSTPYLRLDSSLGSLTQPAIPKKIEWDAVFLFFLRSTPYKTAPDVTCEADIISIC